MQLGYFVLLEEAITENTAETLCVMKGRMVVRKHQTTPVSLLVYARKYVRMRVRVCVRQTILFRQVPWDQCDILFARSNCTIANALNQFSY